MTHVRPERRDGHRVHLPPVNRHGQYANEEEDQGHEQAIEDKGLGRLREFQCVKKPSKQFRREIRFREAERGYLVLTRGVESSARSRKLAK